MCTRKCHNGCEWKYLVSTLVRELIFNKIPQKYKLVVEILNP